MAIPRFVCTPLHVDGACTYDLIEQSLDGGSEIELFQIIKSHPAPDMPQITVSNSKKNVIRGLHCSPHHKLVCCPTGRAFDVLVDLRPTSPTFMKWDGAWLSKTKHIVIPPFCAHGFFAAEDDTSILYLQGGCFAPALDFSVKYDDPAVGIQWPAPIDSDSYVISPKDLSNPLSGDELFAKIRERLEHPIESLKLGPYADIGIVADQPSPILGVLIDSIKAKGKTWHYLSSNGEKRETLQEELYALKPLIGVIYFLNNDSGNLAGNFTKVLNVASSCDVRKFPLVILLGKEDFPGKEKIVALLKENGNNVRFADLPVDQAGIDAVLASLIQ
jgi:dTDP-4-dehydrorhamnose 3,5-epimerase